MQTDISISGLNRALLVLDEKKVRKAARMALNDTVKQARTAADKQLRAKFALKAGYIKQKLKVTAFASDGSLRAIISGGSRSLGMQHFAARQTKKGVSVKILKGQKPTLLVGAFMTPYKSGQIGVWHRAGKGNGSGNFGGLVERRVITVASMFNQAEVGKVAQQVIDTKWPERFAAQLKRQFK